jgi:hypothetical protein
MSFMLAEVFQLQVVTVYVLLKYAIHVRHNGSSTNQTSHSSGPVSNMQEENPLSEQQLSLWYRVVVGCIDMVHHIHMLLWSSLRLNVTTLVILLHLQYLYQEISSTWKRYKDFKFVVHLLNFGPVQCSTSLCAICWDVLGTHRLLPCGHGFHRNCLLQWIPQSCSCPVCRKGLLDYVQQPTLTVLTPNELSISNMEHTNSCTTQHSVHNSSQTFSHSSEENFKDFSPEAALNSPLPNANSCAFYQVNKHSFYLEEEDDESSDETDPLSNKRKGLLPPQRNFSRESNRSLKTSFSSSGLLTGPLQVDLDLHNDFLHASSNQQLK